MISIADTTNALQQSLPPTRACFMAFDEVHHVWYKHQFGKDIDPEEYNMPVLHALQGHPEAGALWDEDQ